MNKKAVYKRVIYFMHEYHKVCIYERKHDHFIFGQIIGLIDALYVSGTIDIISSCKLTDWIMYKTDKFLKSGFIK